MLSMTGRGVVVLPAIGLGVNFAVAQLVLSARWSMELNPPLLSTQRPSRHRRTFSLHAPRACDRRRSSAVNRCCEFLTYRVHEGGALGRVADAFIGEQLGRLQSTQCALIWPST